MIHGNLRKMSAIPGHLVQYHWVLGEHVIPLNDCLGKTLQLRFTGQIHCIQCGRRTRKSYQQGYCFPCLQRLAECHFCVVRPEKCKVRDGDCRHDDWAHSQCAQPHTVYLANSSGIKVGITRCSQIPTRWIDQGAVQGLPIFQVANRYQSGVIEMCLKHFVNDRTDWRRLLRQSATPLDLIQEYKTLLKSAEAVLRETISSFTEDVIWLDNAAVTELTYPISQYPQKISSLSLDKDALVTGVLQGIKGQYLLFDSGVINVRKFSGYEVELSVKEHE